MAHEYSFSYISVNRNSFGDNHRNFYNGGRMTGGKHILGERIEAMMVQKGWKQQDLAEAVGMKQPTIHALINTPGRGSKKLHLIAKALGTTTDYLTGETNDPAGHTALPPSPPPPATMIKMDVALPNAELLSAAFRSCLRLDDHPMRELPPHLVDELAQALAEHFPDALAGVVSSQGRLRASTAIARQSPSKQARRTP